MSEWYHFKKDATIGPRTIKENLNVGYLLDQFNYVYFKKYFFSYQKDLRCVNKPQYSKERLKGRFVKTDHPSAALENLNGLVDIF